MFCPKCGVQNADNNTFCQSCGNPLTAAQSEQSAFQQPEQSAFQQPQQGGLKHKRIGLIIWGAILIAVGLSITLSAIQQSNLRYTQYYYNTPNYYRGFLFFGLVVLVGGGVMLAFGIRNAVMVTRHNATVVKDKMFYTAICPYCRYEIRAQSSDFLSHFNYPEGFKYCPSCRKPVSKNIFLGQTFSNNEPIFIAICPYCRNNNRAVMKDFRPHRNYPEGYKYCTVCKRPISMNAFAVHDSGNYR